MPSDEDARHYRRRRRLASLAGMGATVALLLVALLAGPAEALADALEALIGVRLARVALYAAILLAAVELLQLPLAFYRGYILERRVGLSVQTAVSWLADSMKGFALTLLFGAAAATGVYGLMDASPGAWWLFAAGALWAAAALLASLAPIVILPLFFRFEPLPEGLARDRLLSLCARAGVPAIAASVWRLSAKSERSNAAVVGWGSTRRVIVSDTLLEDCSIEEVEAVLAHELGHHVRRDVRNAIMLQLPLALAAFLVLHLASGWLAGPLGLGSRESLSAMPLLALILLGVSLPLVPLVNTCSRRREAAADGFALEATGNPAAFISAMEHLAARNLAERSPHRLIEALLYSHPAIDRRIERARAWRGAGVSRSEPHRA